MVRRRSERNLLGSIQSCGGDDGTTVTKLTSIGKRAFWSGEATGSQREQQSIAGQAVVFLRRVELGGGQGCVQCGHSLMLRVIDGRVEVWRGGRTFFSARSNIMRRFA